MEQQPVISAKNNLPELTIKGIFLGLLLAVVLAASNTFLALKIGVLTASSIPAAILSMGILKLFPRSNILENNCVQTCASAGEAIAGGIVYTAPGLVIIHAWLHFPFIETFLLALIGGLMGVIITVPLRRVFMTSAELPFPEAQAISQVLISGTQQGILMAPMLIAGAIGALMECAQTAFKLIASSYELWITKGTTTFGFGTGFSATLIGAGYLIGLDVGLSILIGAIISNGVAVPIYSHFFMHQPPTSPSATAHAILSDHLRYMGISAMLLAGFLTLIKLLKPFIQSIKHASSAAEKSLSTNSNTRLRTDQDTPNIILALAMLLLLTLCATLFAHTFPLKQLPIHSGSSHFFFITISLLYVLIFGTLFSAITAYFSGLVGVASSPGSSIAIASVLIAATLIGLLIHAFNPQPSTETLKAAAAITIMLATVVMGSACVANNNSQDLKVGHLVGATPWKQQLMLSLGAVVAAIVAPLVMELLFKVYGIAHIMPHAGMDPNQSLPAPPAAAMAAVTQAVFTQQLPLKIMIAGAIILTACACFIPLCQRFGLRLSLIGIAIGMYLPLSSSTPLFIGAAISAMVKRRNNNINDNKGIIIACGLVAGAALTNVILAIPFATMHNPDLLVLLSPKHHRITETLGFLSTILIAYYLFKQATQSDD